MSGKTESSAVTPLRLVAAVLVAAPLIVFPWQVDFALLPQQAFVQAGALALAVFVLASPGVRRRLPAGLHALDLPLGAFLGWSAVSLASSADRSAGVRVLAHWLACAVVYLAVSRLARQDDQRRLARGALAGAALAAGVGLCQVAFGLTLVPQAVGPSATMANRDLAAGYLVAVAPLAILAWSGRRRWLVAVALAAILGFVPFTHSRAAAGAVALQLAVLITVLVVREVAGKARLRVPAIAAALGLATLGIAASLVWTLGDAAKGRSLGIRWELASSALAMGADHPLHGVGLGRFGALYPAYGGAIRGEYGVLRVEHAHDELLQVFAETGLPGLLALGWIAAAAASLLVRLGRSPRPGMRRAALALGLSGLALAVEAACGFPLRSALAPLLLSVLLGLCARLDRACAPRPAPASAPRPERTHRLLVWTVGPAAALVLAGATTLSIVRLAADQALREMALAEADGRHQDAVVAGRRAVRLDPRATTQLALARAELRVGRREAAHALLEAVLAAHPYDATAVATLGSARWAAGDREGARASWRFARALGVGAPLRLRPAAFQAATPAAGAACTSAVAVRVGPKGLLDVTARGQALSDVLACISARTGLRVDYDGPRPRQRVTLNVAAQPLPEAVASLLEGQGINYVFSGTADATAAHRLIVFGAARSSGSGARTAAAPSSSFQADDPAPDVDDPIFGDPAAEGERRGPVQPGARLREPRFVPAPDPSDPAFAQGVEPPAESGGGVEPPPVEQPPEYPEPAQLTPTVRHWEPWPPALSTRGSAVPYAPVSADGV